MAPRALGRTAPPLGVERRLSACPPRGGNPPVEQRRKRLGRVGALCEDAGQDAVAQLQLKGPQLRNAHPLAAPLPTVKASVCAESGRQRPLRLRERSVRQSS